MDAKDAALIAKGYFEETKNTRYFLFDAPEVRRLNGQWKVICEIRELFEDSTKKFEITVDNQDGIILDVKKLD
jgi:hypothetical protein